MAANRPKFRLSDLEIENKNVDYQTSALGNSPLIAQVNSELEDVKKLHNDFKESSGALLKRFESQDLLLEISKVNKRLEGLDHRIIQFQVPMKWQKGRHTFEMPLQENIVVWWWDQLQSTPYYWVKGEIFGRWVIREKKFVFSWEEVEEPLWNGEPVKEGDINWDSAMKQKENNQPIIVKFRALILPEL